LFGSDDGGDGGGATRFVSCERHVGTTQGAPGTWTPEEEEEDDDDAMTESKV
jgi:hypothetical protein